MGAVIAVAMLLEHGSATEERLAEGTGMGKDAIKEEVEEDGDETDSNAPKVLQETVLDFDFVPGLPILRARELALEWGKDAFGSTAEEDITGVSIWSAALILSRWVIDNREVFDGKQVCELGSGCGVSGLAVYRYTNAARVVLSDLFAHTIQNLEHNVELNQTAVGADEEEKDDAPVLDCCGRCGAVQRFTPDNPEGKLMTCGGCKSVAYCSRECQKKAWKKHKPECKAIRARREEAEARKQSERGVVQVEAIDWAQRETWPISCDDDKFDVLFGSDLVYHQEIVPALVNVVDGMLASEGRFVHVASQARHSLVEFKDAMEARGFRCDVEEVPEDYKTNPLVGHDAGSALFHLHFNEMSDVYCIYTFTRTAQP
jgi:predicted nicotinamide N-methyase